MSDDKSGYPVLIGTVEKLFLPAKSSSINVAVVKITNRGLMTGDVICWGNPFNGAPIQKASSIQLKGQTEPKVESGEICGIALQVTIPPAVGTEVWVIEPTAQEPTFLTPGPRKVYENP